jgi:cytochrome c556
MRVLLALGCTAALFVAAACNQEAPSADGQADTADANASANASGAATGNVAAPADVAAFMHDRHERYEEIGDAMKGINRELKASSPSVPVIQRHAAQIAQFAPQVPGLFPPGTGPETGHRTRAKAEIWSDAQTFRQRAEQFNAAATRFNQAAQSGDVAAIRAALPALGDSCKNCHDRFRGPEQEH